MSSSSYRIRPVSRAVPIPLCTFVQRYWHFPELRRRFNNTIGLEANQRLDHAALSASVECLVNRHEILRTTFGKTADCQPVQLVNRQLDWSISHHRFDDEGTATERIHQLIKDLHEMPFDIESGPLWRLALIDRANKSVLVFVQHHFIGDGISMYLIIEELFALYQRLRRGLSCDESKPELHFADYAHFENEPETQRKYDSRLSYWKTVLDDPEELFETDYDGEYVERRQHLVLERALLESIKDFSHDRGLSLFVFFLTLLRAALFVVTKKKDTLISIPYSNRNKKVLARMLGQLAYTIVSKGQVDEHCSLNDLLRKINRDFLTMYKQRIPLNYAISRLYPDLYRKPTEVAQVQLNIIPFAGEFKTEDLAIEGIANHAHVVCLPLRVLVLERETGLEVGFAYNSRVVSSGLVAQLKDVMPELLSFILRAPDCSLSEFRGSQENVSFGGCNSDIELVFRQVTAAGWTAGDKL